MPAAVRRFSNCSAHRLLTKPTTPPAPWQWRCWHWCLLPLYTGAGGSSGCPLGPRRQGPARGRARRARSVPSVCTTTGGSFGACCALAQCGGITFIPSCHACLSLLLHSSEPFLTRRLTCFLSLMAPTLPLQLWGGPNRGRAAVPHPQRADLPRAAVLLGSLPAAAARQQQRQLLAAAGRHAGLGGAVGPDRHAALPGERLLGPGERLVCAGMHGAWCI